MTLDDDRRNPAVEDQETLAKAVYTDTQELRQTEDFRSAGLAVAVQLPKRASQERWDDVEKWISRDAQRVEAFEDRASIVEKAEVPAQAA